MGESNDFQMMPAHAHLNLVGWVTMSLYGTFYALTAQTMSNRLAWTNFALSALGVLTMVPSLAALLATNNSAVLPSLIAGEALTVLGLLTFLISVWREFFRKRA
ncbi:MAG: hypothetical protein KGJ28_12090 [Alphaproteobacteria bacterium]|nr:hypothetical protein [Alphaproteobacteria bacterium]